MRIFLFLALLYASALSAVSALSDVETKKLGAIQKFAASEGDLLALSDSNFGKYALNANRPYHLFVIFNARNPRHNCGPCGSFEDELEVLAHSFNLMKAEDGSLPDVFFARAEFDANQRSFQKYGLRNVPVLAYYPPTESEPSPQREAINSPYVGELDAEGAAVFVRGHTGVTIDIYRSPWNKLFALAVILTTLVLMFRYASHQLFALVMAIRNNTTFWMLLCISVYFIAISGVLYDIIRGVPTVGVDRQGRPAFFHPQSGQQYVVEGLIIGTLNLGTAGIVIALVKFSPRAEKASDRSMWAAGLGLLALLFCYQYVRFYKFKSGWYPF